MLLRSSQPATGLSALAPAQRAGAQRLRALAQSGRSRSSAGGGIAAHRLRVLKAQLSRQDLPHPGIGTLVTRLYDVTHAPFAVVVSQPLAI